MNPIHVIGVDGTPWNEIALGLLRAADTDDMDGIHSRSPFSL